MGHKAPLIDILREHVSRNLATTSAPRPECPQILGSEVALNTSSFGPLSGGAEELARVFFTELGLRYPIHDFRRSTSLIQAQSSAPDTVLRRLVACHQEWSVARISRADTLARLRIAVSSSRTLNGSALHPALP